MEMAECCLCKRVRERGRMTQFEPPKGIVLPCQICGQMLLRRKAKKHLTKHADSLFKCKMCSLMFHSLSSMKNHYYSHWIKKSYVSCQCCILADSSSGVHRLTHYSSCSHHKDYGMLELKRCNFCGEVLVASCLRIHLASHLKEMLERSYVLLNVDGRHCYVCASCRGRFGDPDLMPGPAKDREKQAQCDVCGKLLRKASALRNHMVSHLEERPWTCSLCGSTFKSNNYLQKHLNTTHNDEKPHQCTICKKKFKHIKFLEKHLLAHAGNRPFPCNLCQKAFTRKDCLKNHKLTHSNERRYSCQFCGRGFKKSDALRVHLRTHTKEKPFSCQRCGKTFSHKVSLVKYHNCLVKEESIEHNN